MKKLLLYLLCSTMLFSCSPPKNEGRTESETSNDPISAIIKNNHIIKRIKYRVNYKYNSPKQTLEEEIFYDNEGRRKMIIEYYSDDVKISSKKELQYYKDSTTITEQYEKEILEYDEKHNLINKTSINFKVGETQKKKYYYDKNNNCIEIDECNPGGKCVLSKKTEYDISNNSIYSNIYTITSNFNPETHLRSVEDSNLSDSTVYFYDKKKLIKAIVYYKHLTDGIALGEERKEVNEIASVIKYTYNKDDLLTEYYEKFDTLNDLDDFRKITYRYDDNKNAIEEINIFKQSEFQNGKNNEKEVINRTYLFQKLIAEKITFKNDIAVPSEHFKYEYRKQ